MRETTSASDTLGTAAGSPMGGIWVLAREEKMGQGKHRKKQWEDCPDLVQM